MTLIVLPAPGAPARQLEIPGHFPLIIATVCLLSLSLSLLVGRKARAWFQPESTPTQLVASESAPALQEVGHVRFSTAPREHARAAPSAPDLGEPELAAADWTQEESERLASLGGQPLQLFDVNTQQRIALSPFGEHGQVDAGAFDALSHFLRCRRTGETIPMNPRLIALLSRISHYFSETPLHVISAHRAVDGITTRRTSQHARGTAADIRIPGVSIQTLSQAARMLGAAGIGLYTRNRFVHVDVRSQPYSWSDAVKRKDAEADDEAARDAELDAEATSLPTEAAEALPDVALLAPARASEPAGL